MNEQDLINITDQDWSCLVCQKLQATKKSTWIYLPYFILYTSELIVVTIILVVYEECTSAVDG